MRHNTTMIPGPVTRWLLLACFFPAVAAAQEVQLEEGRLIFESQCGSCHGPFGNGGKGANLAQPQLRRATDDQALQNIIRRGIPGTEMPSHFLNPQQISNVAAYVKTLGLIEPEEIPGDPGRGAEVYASLDCLVCHTLNGEGGIVGPLLDDVGARRSAAHIREALLTPDATVPNDFLQLRAIIQGGRSVTGIRVNEDGFSVQLRDLDGNLHSFWKDELQVLEKDWGSSPMATYQGRLTPDQLDDLVSYLVSLKGSQ